MRLSLQFSHLAKASFFEGMQPSQVDRFLDACVLRTVPDGTVILQQDTEATGIALIANGCVEVTSRNPDGRVDVLHHAREAETLGCMEVMAEQPCIASCTTVGDATYLFCPVDRLRNELAHPLIQRNVMRIAQARMLRQPAPPCGSAILAGPARLCISFAAIGPLQPRGAQPKLHRQSCKLLAPVDQPGFGDPAGGGLDHDRKGKDQAA